MAPSLQSILSTPSSPMGRVEKATSSVLMAPNWLINTDITHTINSNPWKAKPFVKAVKKRLRNKNSRVQFLALTLLEAMVKNCGDFVHFQVVDVGILQEMVKIVRNTRNMQVREKILVLLEYWQEEFGGPNGKYPQYYYTYAELKRSGIRFVQSQVEDDLPITNETQVVERFDEVMASESFTDLVNIKNVMDLFNNMLQAINPKDDEAIKDEVITDLASQCRINQKKLMQLIDTTENDGFLREALATNDSLQNALSKYDALIRPSVPPPLAPAIAEQSDDKEEEEDGFSHLANRKSLLKTTGEQEISANKDGVDKSDALIVFDPPAPADSSKNERDMIDLLSLTLSPQTDMPSPPPPPTANQNQNPFSNSPNWEEYHNYSQPRMPNEGYTTYNSYIAPWSQVDVVEQLPQYTNNYLATPWISPEASLNPFVSATSTQTQYPESQSRAVIGSSASTGIAENSKALQNFRSFGSKENQIYATLINLRDPSSAPKPYKPDNLFDDLIKLRNSDGSLKTRDVSSLWGSGQGMASVK
ncbi:TOM1-like protein 2 isoform X1 [Phalaenopsis equestris]|uniref:TOM1-like protein 2 isoform X1 n=1 Tax=Phalaenopsis equestris TaxID=78828 RepID=UPI0009E3E15E|nr:TOM1-like protein 2 isoform X1 [Phalaenopsis equestris]